MFIVDSQEDIGFEICVSPSVLKQLQDMEKDPNVTYTNVYPCLIDRGIL